MLELELELEGAADWFAEGAAVLSGTRAELVELPVPDELVELPIPGLARLSSEQPATMPNAANTSRVLVIFIIRSLFYWETPRGA